MERVLSRFPCLFAILTLAACHTPAPTQPQQSYRLVDLSDDYERFYDRTDGMPTADRVAAFKAEIVPLFPAFYRVGRPGGASTEEGLDARIARSIEAFAAQRAGYERAARGFTAQLGPALASFRQSFPDATDFGDIYLVHSLGEMDGGTREVDGTVYFVFGADVIARVHPPGTERPFFHHELFHRYQSRWFPGCDQIWCGLWTEGGAVLAADELNPGADDAQLLLTLPAPIRPVVDANLTEAVCTARAKLDSSADEDWGAMFSFQRINETLPPRFGYYVGYLALREARNAHSLAEIAHMSAEQARPALEAALARLADCSAN